MKVHLHGRTFLIANRNNPTSKKPPTYLLEILPDGQRKYISSLYPLDTPGCYRMEKNGVWYVLDVSTQEHPRIGYYTPVGSCALSITIGTSNS